MYNHNHSAEHKKQLEIMKNIEGRWFGSSNGYYSEYAEVSFTEPDGLYS
jgi:hypothetical protein